MTKKILVVDDDIQTLKLVGLVLERKGYDIVAARKGGQALEKAWEEQPDLVILDIMMPDIDGYEVSRRLRADPETASLPILMFTAKSGVQDKVTGFEAGADDFLTKPIHPEELVSHVEAILARTSRAQPTEKAAPANIIGFLGAKGGVGTTTLAVNAAVALARDDILADDEDPLDEGGPVILAEMRPGMATASFQLDLPQTDGLASILKQPVGQIDGDFVEARLQQHESGLLVLSSRLDPIGATESLSAKHVDAVVRHLGALSSYLLLDLGVGIDEVNRRLLPHCRRVIVTVEANELTLTLAEALLAELNQTLNIPRHRINLVLVKRSRSATSFTQEEIEDRLGHDMMGMIPPAPDLAFQSLKQQMPMVMMSVDSLAVRQFKTFARDLVEAL
jgi:pilus assembly protein CpaE